MNVYAYIENVYILSTPDRLVDKNVDIFLVYFSDTVEDVSGLVFHFISIMGIGVHCYFNTGMS